ncbi:MAG: hypothetical protein AAF423_05480 [Pseudomonadota bacterium]
MSIDIPALDPEANSFCASADTIFPFQDFRLNAATSVLPAE